MLVIIIYYELLLLNFNNKLLLYAYYLLAEAERIQSPNQRHLTNRSRRNTLHQREMDRREGITIRLMIYI